MVSVCTCPWWEGELYWISAKIILDEEHHFVREDGREDPQRDPPVLLSAMHQSEFCLQPPGDSPSRRSFVDALLVGCIPGIFQKDAAWSQYVHYLPENGARYSVFIPLQRKSSIFFSFEKVCKDSSVFSSTDFVTSSTGSTLLLKIWRNVYVALKMTSSMDCILCYIDGAGEQEQCNRHLESSDEAEDS